MKSDHYVIKFWQKLEHFYFFGLERVNIFFNVWQYKVESPGEEFNAEGGDGQPKKEEEKTVSKQQTVITPLIVTACGHYWPIVFRRKLSLS